VRCAGLRVGARSHVGDRGVDELLDPLENHAAAPLRKGAVAKPPSGARIALPGPGATFGS
jgi:hypothetical protein